MITPQLSLDLNREIIVDNFAGGGGASTGLEIGLGRNVDIAINHAPDAIKMHEANHPQTTHYVEDVYDVDPLEVTEGRPVGLCWFSPDCTHFSKAKGGKPKDKKVRGLAWVVINWVNKVSPRIIMLENVEEFQTWGPIGQDGHPASHRKGWYFDCFCGALRRRGYKVEFRQLKACDYGAPTIRKRLFMIARRDGQPIVWPEPTHGGKGQPPYRTAAECIDWSIPAPSIFERKRPLAEATCRRIAKGIHKYVLDAEKPFIVNLTHGGRLEGVDEPFKTITGANRGEKAVCTPYLAELYGTSSTVSLERPSNTLLGKQKHALVAPVLTECANASTERVFDAAEPLRTQCAQVKGGHFALVSAFLAKHYTGVTGQSMEQPTGTVTAKDHHGVVAAHITKMRGTSQHGQTAEDPLHTVAAQGLHYGLVSAFMTKYYGTGDGGQGMKEPFHTVTSKDRFNLVTVNIDGTTYAIKDIGLRMLQPRELYKAQGFPEDYAIGDDGRHGLNLTKTKQVKMCGNAVCPPLAAALAAANCPELGVYEDKEPLVAAM